MRSKERLERAILGEEVDHIPFAPKLAYWWDFAPKVITDQGQFSFIQSIGADPLLSGFCKSFKTSDIMGIGGEDLLPFRDCEMHYHWGNKKRVTIWDTPVGSMTMLQTYAETARTWMVVKHPVEEIEDYKTLMYLVERMQIEENYVAVGKLIEHVGDDGLVVAQISPFLKTAFQSLVEHFVGTVKLVYDLFDYPELIDELIALMQEKTRESLTYSLKGPADFFISWEDTSTMNINPDQFRNYIKPEIQSWTKELKSRNKHYIHHACGHIKDLLSDMSGEGAAAVESITPPPTGNTHIWEAQQVLRPAGTSVIGGVDPVLLQELTIKELRTHAADLLQRTERCGFVLANSDSCPPDVSIEAFKVLAEIVKA